MRVRLQLASGALSQWRVAGHTRSAAGRSAASGGTGWRQRSRRANRRRQCLLVLLAGRAYEEAGADLARADKPGAVQGYVSNNHCAIENYRIVRSPRRA